VSDAAHLNVAASSSHAASVGAGLGPTVQYWWGAQARINKNKT
jgi:hypothetical protein